MIINFPESSVVSGMSGLPGDGITLWSRRSLCDQRTLVRSLYNYSLVTTSWGLVTWSLHHWGPLSTQLMLISMFSFCLLSCQTSGNYDLICELSVDLGLFVRMKLCTL